MDPQNKMIEYTQRRSGAKGYVPLARIIKVVPVEDGAEIFLETGTTATSVYASDTPESIAEQMDSAFGWMTRTQINKLTSAMAKGTQP